MGALKKKQDNIVKLLQFYYSFTRRSNEEKAIVIGKTLQYMNQRSQTYNFKKLYELSKLLEYHKTRNQITLPKGTTDFEIAEFLRKVKHYMTRENLTINSLTIVITI